MWTDNIWEENNSFSILLVKARHLLLLSSTMSKQLLVHIVHDSLPIKKKKKTSSKIVLVAQFGHFLHLFHKFRYKTVCSLDFVERRPCFPSYINTYQRSAMSIQNISRFE